MEKFGRLSPAEKSAVRAMLDGASSCDAARSTGLAPDRVGAIYTQFQRSLVDVMEDSARQFVAESLSHPSIDAMPEVKGGLGCQSLDGMMTDIMRDLGFPPLEEIDDTAPGWVVRRGKRALASSPKDVMDEILAELGVFENRFIDDTAPGFVDRRVEGRGWQRPGAAAFQPGTG